MSQESHRSLLDDDVDLMSEVAEGILERDRQRMRREVLRWMSFVCAVLSWCVLQQSLYILDPANAVSLVSAPGP